MLQLVFISIMISVAHTLRFFLRLFCALLVILFYIFSIASSVNAQFTPEITYQAKLVDPTTGAPVVDGLYNIKFQLCTDKDCASYVWEEEHIRSNRVDVANGLFSVLLGSITPLAEVNLKQNLYLGVNIGGTENTDTPPYDGLMKPLRALGMVPVAAVALELQSDQGANSIDASSSEPTFQITQKGTGDAFQVNAGDTSPFVINAEGKIGIGTSTPSTALEVHTNTADDFAATVSNISPNAYGLLIKGSHTVASSTYPALKIDTGTTTALKVEFGGKVGIGISTPEFTLDVGGDINFTGNLYNNGLAFNSGGGKFTDGASTTDAVFTQGNVGIGTSTPSALLEISTSSEPQLRISFDSANSASFSVNALGNLSLSLDGGESVSLEDSNLEVCESGACPQALTDLASSTTGNIVVENTVYSGGGLLLGTVAECTSANKGQLRNSAYNELEQCNGHKWVALKKEESYGVVYSAIDGRDHVAVKSYGFAYNGTVTSSTNNTLTDSTANFPDSLVGKRVLIYEGVGVGQERTIESVATTTITLSTTWDTNPQATSKYIVGEKNDLFEYDTEGKILTRDDGERKKTYHYDANGTFIAIMIGDTGR